jgi:hypothetical protein
MSLEVVRYNESHREDWDAFCAGAANATWLHTRRFLGYHGGRFADASLLIVADGRLVGVLPAAHSPRDEAVVVSHPGATYGGMVHQSRLAGERMVEALGCVAEHFRARGCERLLYKPLPWHYARMPAQDDLYALFRLGAYRVRCDLSSAIDLAARREPSERRRRCLRKAQNSVTLVDGTGWLNALWPVLADNLARKHGAVPVHSQDEMCLLASLFPDEMRVHCALADGRVEAGIILFNALGVWHVQYIAASATGYELSALDAVFEAAITAARAAGARFFDFGTSNEAEGTILNDGLYRFKSEFGGGGVAHEYYELEL